MTTDSLFPSSARSRSGVAHAIVLAAVLLTATACTALDASAELGSATAPAPGSVPPSPAASSGAGSSGHENDEDKTLSAESIKVLSRQNVSLETGRFVEMTIEAPVQTRFFDRRRRRCRYRGAVPRPADG